MQIFRKIHLLEHAWTKSCPQTEDRQTDGQGETNTLFAGGGVIIIRIKLQTWSLYYHVKTLHLEVFTVSKKKIVTFYLKYNCRLEKKFV